ncbi:uncharacterized protein LOC111900908 [Lactuca sativa]|uniref:uncharacterized protein LOC111900908 n=1 Tax=Lactuca sativa TaxID=4236 RepID=UPI000CD8419F|nr:uncharacterized protein LOC111900908 [Lactuca sativa]
MDDSKSGHTDIHVINKAPTKENKDKPKFCEYHKRKTHDTNECTVLKREIDEKQPVGNIVDKERYLREKFGEDKHQLKNQNDGGRDREKRVEILSITGPCPCTNRQSRYPDARPYHQNILNIAFSMNDPRPKHWDPNDPLHITSFVSRHRIEQLYIDYGSRVNVIYKHCLSQLPIEWIEYLQPLCQGLLVGFTSHHIWQTGTVRLLFALVRHDREKEITRVLDFSVVNCPAEHNILLGLPALFQLRAIPSTIHGIIKFSTSDGSATIMANKPANKCDAQ